MRSLKKTLLSTLLFLGSFSSHPTLLALSTFEPFESRLQALSRLERAGEASIPF